MRWHGLELCQILPNFVSDRRLTQQPPRLAGWGAKKEDTMNENFRFTIAAIALAILMLYWLGESVQSIRRQASRMRTPFAAIGENIDSANR